MAYNPLLNDVVHHYDLLVNKIENVGSFHKLFTNRGTKVVKSWNNIEALKEAHYYREQIAKQGFRRLDRFIRTIEGKAYISYGDIGYVLTDWLDGEAPSCLQDKDMRIMGRTLATLQEAMSKLDVTASFEPWSHHFRRGLNHFLAIKNQIKAKATRDTMDEIVIVHIESHMKQMEESIQMALKVEKNSFRNERNPIWSHGRLQPQSILIDEYGEGWI